MEETNNSAQAAGNLGADSWPNYTQLYSVGLDAKGNEYEARINGNGSVEWRHLNPGGEPGQYAQINTDGFNCKAISAMSGAGHENTSYIIVLISDDNTKNPGQVGIIYQGQNDTTWRWWGIMPMKPVVFAKRFNWLATAVDRVGNPQIILLNETATPVLLWQDKPSGNWTWSWLPYDGPNVTPPNYSLHLNRVQIGVGNNNNLQAVFIGLDFHPYLIWQDSSTGYWHSYGKQLPSNQTNDFIMVQLFKGNNDNLQCVFQAINNDLYLIWQDNSTGIWHWYNRLPIQKDKIDGNDYTIQGYFIKRHDEKSASLFISYNSPTNEGQYNIYLISQLNGVWKWEGLKYKDASSPYPS